MPVASVVVPGQGHGGVQDAKIEGHAANRLGSGFTTGLHGFGVINQLEGITQGILSAKTQPVAQFLALERLSHAHRGLCRQHPALDLVGHVFQGPLQAPHHGGHQRRPPRHPLRRRA